MRRQRRKQRSRINHERWLVSYADFITLLFAFFVVMYSTSQVDKRKVGKLALAPEISRREVALRSVPDGLVISLLEIGFFESGSAQIKSNSMPAFTRMAGLLAQRKYRIRIEGHTDNVPIHNSRFHSNWELSTERATELIRVLVIRYDFAPERLSAAGYSQYHPVATNDSREGRGLNRRVDVVVLGRDSAPHNAARTQSSAPRKLPDDDHGPAMSASDRLARFAFERQMYMHRLVRLLYPVP